MINKITFLNAHWVWLIIIGATLIWSIFIWKEYSNRGKQRFWIKIVISFFATISLALIALKPAANIPNKTIKTVVLTEGYNNQQLDSLKRKYKRLNIINYKVNHPILDNTSASDSIFMLGDGIQPFDFWQLDNYNVNYMPGKKPSGVVRFTYTQKNTVGHNFTFKGLYHNPIKGNQLVLQGPGEAGLDSISVVSTDDLKFKFNIPLTVQGRYLYSLVEKDSLGKVLSRDPIPLIVEKSTPLQVLILNEFPTFETKYLKNYLAEMGHQVLVRSQITKKRYKFEYFNMSKMPLGILSKKNLEVFDMVIIDASTLRNLGRRSRVALENSVIENGLGIFIQPDKSFFKSSIVFNSFNFISDKSKHTTLIDQDKEKLAKYDFVFDNEFLLQPIHTTIDNRIISAYKRIGKGRVGTTVLENTYTLQLKGDSTVYRQLWSKLVESICNTKNPITEWSSRSGITYKNQPFKFQIRTLIKAPLVKKDKGHRISLQNDIDIPDLWTGITYPREIGWNTLIIEQDSTTALNYYVTNPEKWAAYSKYKIKKENHRKFDNRDAHIVTQSIHPKEVISPIGLYVLFLICIGYLWLEPKIVE